MSESKRVQLQLTLPYKHEPREHPTVRRYLDDGYRIEAQQRLSDRELLLTLARA